MASNNKEIQITVRLESQLKDELQQLANDTERSSRILKGDGGTEEGKEG